MTELEQQALLEPEPTRVVRASDTASWWGVDPSTKRVSIAWQHPEGSPIRPGAATRSFPSADGGERLGLIYRETWDFVTNYLLAPALKDSRDSWCGWPGVVLVEQPSGKYVTPPLLYAVGVVQAAIWHALAGVRGVSAPLVETITSGEWKKLATGRGDAGSKRRGGKEEIIRWAQENGYTGHLDDEADAFGIATAARRLVRFAP